MHVEVPMAHIIPASGLSLLDNRVSGMWGWWLDGLTVLAKFVYIFCKLCNEHDDMMI